MKLPGKIKNSKTLNEKRVLAGTGQLSETNVEGFVEKVFAAFAFASDRPATSDTESFKAHHRRFMKRLPLLKHQWRTDFAEFFFTALWKCDFERFDALRTAMMKKKHCRKNFAILLKESAPKPDILRSFLLNDPRFETAPFSEIRTRVRVYHAFDNLEDANLIRVLNELYPNRRRGQRGRPKIVK